MGRGEDGSTPRVIPGRRAERPRYVSLPARKPDGVKPKPSIVTFSPIAVRSGANAHRPLTTLAHLRDDFARATGEDDLTHLDEILSRHGLRRDPWAGSPAKFSACSRHNAKNRCLHHPVFDLSLQRAVLEECGWHVVGAEAVRPLHPLTLARRPGSRAERRVDGGS